MFPWTCLTPLAALPLAWARQAWHGLASKPTLRAKSGIYRFHNGRRSWSPPKVITEYRTGRSLHFGRIRPVHGVRLSLGVSDKSQRLNYSQGGSTFVGR